MKQILLSSILFLFCICLTGQTQSDSISVVKKPLGTAFRQNGRFLTPNQLLEITKADQKAYAEMQVAKGNYSVTMVFSYIGGFLIGWPIGTALAGGDANWTLAGIGAGCILLSIPFSSGYTKHAKNAVRLYNERLKTSSLIKPDFKLQLMGSRISFQIRF